MPDIDETPKANEAPRAYAERIAREKAEAVLLEKDATVITADTIVVLDETILGKPDCEESAFRMLSSLSGRAHEVITAVCVKNTEQTAVFSVVTQVIFREVNEMEIRRYIDSGCPMDKAGAYAIQGGAAHMVQAINGSYTNVVGLPLCELHKTLASF